MGHSYIDIGDCPINIALIIKRKYSYKSVEREKVERSNWNQQSSYNNECK
jgi:hypothetical protein